MFCSIEKQFKLLSGKWGPSQLEGSTGGLVTYSFAAQNFENQFRDFDSYIIDTSFQREISASFATWENMADIRFVEVPDSSFVDIRLGWANFDGRGGILGETTIPTSGPLDNTIIVFDVDEDWFTGGDAPRHKIDFSATAIH